MSKDGKRPSWMVPVEYTDTRFEETGKAPGGSADVSEEGHARDAQEVAEILRRPDKGPETKAYECNDTTPLNYDIGPHEEAFGIEDDEMEPLGTEPEFEE